MGYHLEFHDVLLAWQSFLDGLFVTLVLTGIVSLSGLIIGILFASVRVYGPSWAKYVVMTYVELVRNTPLLVQLFLVFFGLPSMGIRLDGYTAAIVVMSFNLGAYMTEIIRAGFEAVPHIQIEAGYSLGLSGFQVFRHVIIFPALKHMIPALISQLILFMLATAVVSQIAVKDVFYVGSLVQSRTFRDFEVYIVVAGIYLALAFLLRMIFSVLYHIAYRQHP